MVLRNFVSIGLHDETMNHIARHLRILATMLIASWLTPAVSAEVVGWCNVTAIRSVTKYGPIHNEVESRMPDAYARQYRDPSCARSAHELAHALNSRLRNQVGGTGKVNALYCVGGRAMVLPEPTNIRLSEVVPRDSSRVALSYDWEKCPLYLCDELSAYLIGTRGYLQYSRVTDAATSLGFAKEVYGYCVRLQGLCRQRGYPHQAALDSYLTWATTELELLRQASVGGGSQRRPSRPSLQQPPRSPIARSQPRQSPPPPQRRAPIQRAPRSYGGSSGGSWGGGGST